MTFNVTSTGCNTSAPVTSNPSQGSCGNNTGSMPSCGSDPKGSHSAWGNVAGQQCGNIGGGKGGSGKKAGSGKGSNSGCGNSGNAGSGKKAGSGKGSKGGSGKKAGCK